MYNAPRTGIDADVNFLYRVVCQCAPPDSSEKINDDLLGKCNFLLDCPPSKAPTGSTKA